MIPATAPPSTPTQNSYLLRRPDQQDVANSEDVKCTVDPISSNPDLKSSDIMVGLFNLSDVIYFYTSLMSCIGLLVANVSKSASNFILILFLFFFISLPISMHS